MLTGTVTLPPMPSLRLSLQPGTGGRPSSATELHDAAGDGAAAGPPSWLADDLCDSAGQDRPETLYTAIGAGNLRAYVQGTDDVGHAGLAN